MTRTPHPQNQLHLLMSTILSSKLTARSVNTTSRTPTRSSQCRPATPAPATWLKEVTRR